MTSTVDVHVRILPTTESAWRIGPTTVTAARIPPNGSRNTDPFQFTQVHNTTASNYDIFRSLSSMVAQVTLGINMTVLAYGQTGSGKTHTMVGNERDGVFFLAAQVLTREAAASRGTTYVRASLIEIYNENVRDLLADPPREIDVRENPDRQIVLDRTTCTFSTVEELHAIIHRGEQARSVAATNLNMRSSRSHTILTLELVHGADGRRASGQMHLVDLAGSENASRAMTAGTQLREGGFINKSLLALGNVVDAIVDGRAHIPYRESKLTRILQSSLGGNAVTAIICCINPHPQDFDQTVAVLRFAQRAQKIVLHPRVLTTQPPHCLTGLGHHFHDLREQIQSLVPHFMALGTSEAFRATYRSVERFVSGYLQSVTDGINDMVDSLEQELRGAAQGLDRHTEELRREMFRIQREIQRIDEMHTKELSEASQWKEKLDSELQHQRHEENDLAQLRQTREECDRCCEKMDRALQHEMAGEATLRETYERKLAEIYSEASEAMCRRHAAMNRLKQQREEQRAYRSQQELLRHQCELLDCELAEMEHELLQRQAVARRVTAANAGFASTQNTIERLTAVVGQQDNTVRILTKELAELEEKARDWNLIVSDDEDAFPTGSLRVHTSATALEVIEQSGTDTPSSSSSSESDSPSTASASSSKTSEVGRTVMSGTRNASQQRTIRTTGNQCSVDEASTRPLIASCRSHDTNTADSRSAAGSTSTREKTFEDLERLLQSRRDVRLSTPTEHAPFPIGAQNVPPCNVTAQQETNRKESRALKAAVRRENLQQIDPNQTAKHPSHPTAKKQDLPVKSIRDEGLSLHSETVLASVLEDQQGELSLILETKVAQKRKANAKSKSNPKSVEVDLHVPSPQEKPCAENRKRPACSDDVVIPRRRVTKRKVKKLKEETHEDVSQHPVDTESSERAHCIKNKQPALKMQKKSSRRTTKAEPVAVSLEISELADSCLPVVGDHPDAVGLSNRTKNARDRGEKKKGPSTTVINKDTSLNTERDPTSEDELQTRSKKKATKARRIRDDCSAASSSGKMKKKESSDSRATKTRKVAPQVEKAVVSEQFDGRALRQAMTLRRIAAAL